MRNDVTKLARMAGQRTRRIVGLMSGTSMDGLDVALCQVTGHGPQAELHLEAFTTQPYGPDYRDHLKEVFSKRTVDLCTLSVLNPWVANVHADLVLASLKQWGIAPGDVDLVASHGQTVFHAPSSFHGRPGMGHATLQIGDGDHMAVRTGIVTVHDFRQKHIAAGGEGAPLAAYGDLLIFASEDEDRILLNIGGIANLTYLPRVGEAFSSDLGPGNTIMDALAQERFGRPFDEGGEIARRGQVSEPLLEALLDHPFFSLPVPKTTGPELFNLGYLANSMKRSNTEGLRPEDQMAALAAFSAAVVIDAIESFCPAQKASVYASGGGAHNPVLRGLISRGLGAEIGDTASLGVDPDAKEAVLMALLANECVAGEAPVMGRIAGMPEVTLGKISLPG